MLHTKAASGRSSFARLSFTWCWRRVDGRWPRSVAKAFAFAMSRLHRERGGAPGKGEGLGCPGEQSCCRPGASTRYVARERGTSDQLCACVLQSIQRIGGAIAFASPASPPRRRCDCYTRLMSYSTCWSLSPAWMGEKRSGFSAVTVVGIGDRTVHGCGWQNCTTE